MGRLTKVLMDGVDAAWQWWLWVAPLQDQSGYNTHKYFCLPGRLWPASSRIIYNNLLFTGYLLHSFLCAVMQNIRCARRWLNLAHPRPSDLDINGEFLLDMTPLTLTQQNLVCYYVIVDWILLVELKIIFPLGLVLTLSYQTCFEEDYILLDLQRGS